MHDKCDMCGGAGKVKCHVCDGHGSYKRSGSTGDAKCVHCDGRKRLKCLPCNGLGYIVTYGGRGRQTDPLPGSGALTHKRTKSKAPSGVDCAAYSVPRYSASITAACGFGGLSTLSARRRSLPPSRALR